MPDIRVVVSVDTEEDNWRPARADISVDNVRELPRFRDFCERLGIRPTYFTTYQVAHAPWAARLLRDLSADGRAEVAAHLHPWNTPPLDEPLLPRNTMLKNLPLPLQRAKIATLTEAIAEGTGSRPTSFRTGRCGLGRDTTQALIEQAYRVDSSVLPWVSLQRTDDGPSFVGAPLAIYTLDGTTDPSVPAPGGPLVEVPMSSGFTRWPFERWGPVHAALTSPRLRPLRLAALASRFHLLRRVMLTPELSSPRDMLRLAKHLVSHGITHLDVTLHSPSLRPGLTPYARSRHDVERLIASIDRFVESLTGAAAVTFSTIAEAAAGFRGSTTAGGRTVDRASAPGT
jgi:hypothetical protein